MTRSEIVGANIAKYRNARGMNQVDFASAIGRSQTMVSMYEKGQRLPSTKIIAKIADVFGVQFNDIYYAPGENRKEHGEDFDWYMEAFDPKNNYPTGKDGEPPTAPKTEEARIVSGWMDSLPKEQREWIVDIVRTVVRKPQ